MLLLDQMVTRQRYTGCPKRKSSAKYSVPCFEHTNKINGKTRLPACNRNLTDHYPRLTDEQRYRVVFLHEQELSSREIAAQIGCNQTTVLKLLGKYDETGSVHDRPKSGRPRSARTAQNIAACRRESRKGFTARSPIRSTCKLANRLGISRGSVTNIYLTDLQKKSLKCLPVQELSEATKRKRLVRCRYLQRRYGYQELQRMWFSDESFFPLSGYVNRQNKRLRARDRASLGNRRIVEGAKFPKALMV